MDPPEKMRVLINVDETSVRLVPAEGKGRAYSPVATLGHRGRARQMGERVLDRIQEGRCKSALNRGVPVSIAQRDASLE